MSSAEKATNAPPKLCPIVQTGEDGYRALRILIEAITSGWREL